MRDDLTRVCPACRLRVSRRAPRCPACGWTLSTASRTAMASIFQAARRAGEGPAPLRTWWMAFVAIAAIGLAPLWAIAGMAAIMLHGGTPEWAGRMVLVLGFGPLLVAVLAVGHVADLVLTLPVRVGSWVADAVSDPRGRELGARVCIRTDPAEPAPGSVRGARLLGAVRRAHAGLDAIPEWALLVLGAAQWLAGGAHLTWHFGGFPDQMWIAIFGLAVAVVPTLMTIGGLWQWRATARAGLSRVIAGTSRLVGDASRFDPEADAEALARWRRGRTTVGGTARARRGEATLRSPLTGRGDLLAYRICGEAGVHELDDGAAVAFEVLTHDGRTVYVRSDEVVVALALPPGASRESRQLDAGFAADRGLPKLSIAAEAVLVDGDAVSVTGDLGSAVDLDGGYRGGGRMEALEARTAPVVITFPDSDE